MTTQLTMSLPAEGGARSLAGQSSHGEVFTRRWVVEFILDLVGYRPEAGLASLTIVEPACGTGAFLVPIVDRLVDSCRRDAVDLADAGDAIRAYELLEANAELSRKATVHRLGELGYSADLAEHLAARWVTTAPSL